jgi:hypothetical protein
VPLVAIVRRHRRLMPLAAWWKWPKNCHPAGNNLSDSSRRNPSRSPPAAGWREVWKALTMHQDDDDPPLLTDPEIVVLYESVRAALLEDREPDRDPVATITRLRELMKAGDREAAFALFMLYDLDEKMRRDRRARRGKAR